MNVRMYDTYMCMHAYVRTYILTHNTQTSMHDPKLSAIDYTEDLILALVPLHTYIRMTHTQINALS
jgi:hypothetical protein